MDSRLIYSATKKLLLDIQWPRVSDTEWVYFGVKEEINKKIILRNIKNHLSSSILYVSLERNNSFETLITEIFLATESLLGVENFTIWNHSLSRVIEFNKIGVFRLGFVLPSRFVTQETGRNGS